MCDAVSTVTVVRADQLHQQVDSDKAKAEGVVWGCACVDCWVLVAGCWLLVAGCWLLLFAVCWLLVAGIADRLVCAIHHQQFCDISLWGKYLGTSRTSVVGDVGL
jgi:hypothetical protein